MENYQKNLMLMRLRVAETRSHVERRCIPAEVAAAL